LMSFNYHPRSLNGARKMKRLSLSRRLESSPQSILHSAEQIGQLRWWVCTLAADCLAVPSIREGGISYGPKTERGRALLPLR
jgi:hypothetical protein